MISRINETKHIIWHQTSKCINRLTASVCNSRQKWNDDKYKCECKELIDKEIRDNVFIWNLSTCECECDRSCEIGECLDYKNCKYRYKLVDKLVEESTNVVGYNETLNDSLSYCVSFTSYIVLFSVDLLTNVIIAGDVFVCFYWYSKKENNGSRAKFNPGT